MADVWGGMFGRDSDSESSEKAEGVAEGADALPPETMRSNCQRAASRLRLGTGSVPECRFYAKGKCTRGADCPFRHASAASSASTDAAAAAAAGRATPEQLQQQQRDPTTTLFGDPALAATSTARSSRSGAAPTTRGCSRTGSTRASPR